MRIINASERRQLVSQSYFQHIEQVLREYFGDGQYSEEKVRGGQTGARKVIFLASGKKYFVKIGEKVERENNIYQSPKFSNKPFLLSPILIPNISNEVLVLPFYDGETLDDFILRKNGQWGEVYTCIRSILQQAAKHLWLDTLTKNETEIAGGVEKYMTDRLDDLSQNLQIQIGDSVIGFADLINMKIVLNSNDERISLPSINEMVDDVVQLFQRFNPPYLSAITGDFQPPNIILGPDGFKVVDLSNGDELGDLAMDIGKLFNFANRFYRVAYIRDGKAPGNSGKAVVSLKAGALEIDTEYSNDPVLQVLMSDLEEEFTRTIADSIADYYLPDRAKLYKFVINVITIKRHIGRRGLSDLLLANIADSYIEIMRKVRSI
ncbi:hypothetical protein A2810_03040 [candidate division Kazan bacterium RIFCSPHIGHO2_01_FULL_49_10]|uniref:Aminoglycoside phosphotransferase domain-containing protein n=1 Tax=candidate division Kazan bacterium RIFCSPLOWO2_01_FULL_48_13 TaxID=1798539 RepID=A0A1F4PNW2_UNCK3|nr:MAG: hypothetical protein A2810_03040 [candidate division Kazan bacterium RIFCSPHIGHO2_01_FULL_49_10]OGB85344.1 MAG: hypothetical protein A2994_01790 [candidate division Kazan bacterium RIFCSPLOWO2_01_FULL_48_13]